MSAAERFLCSDLAWELGVPLVGSATRGDVWFLLEYDKRWGEKALDESTLRQEIKDLLAPGLYEGVEVRTLLIRQDKSRERGGVHFFVGYTDPIQPQLYEYELQDYDDLLDLDIPTMIAGNPGEKARLRSKPLYLVCTNGKRDQCCSIYGPQLYNAMKAEGGEDVWQSSHIGGHNQSPITLFFPYGVNYAHTSPEQIQKCMQAYQQGEIVLHHYRGRVCYEKHVQAAEHFWREQTGVRALPGIAVDDVEVLGEHEWRIGIKTVTGEENTPIHVRRNVSDFEIPITCSKKKIRPIETFHRLD